MTKRFCDICGKMLGPAENAGSFKIGSRITYFYPVKIKFLGEALQKPDICKGCGDRIQEFFIDLANKKKGETK